MSEAMRRRRELRRQFLVRLYETTDGSVSEFVSAWDMAAEIDMAKDEARRIVEYLAEKGWVLVDDHRTGTIRLTASGVDEVEAGA